MSKQQGNSRLKHLDAPYNFVPLSDWVHIPDWGNQVSHDIPFQDGLSGEIHYELVADSPLLVGGEQEKSGNGPGKVRPVTDADGNYIIPGSSLKGMLRAVTEIAAFGRMRFVDDFLPGLRDLGIDGLKSSYHGLVVNKMRTGWLQWDEESGEHRLYPCDSIPVRHEKLERWMGMKQPLFQTDMTVREKYEAWANACVNDEWVMDPKALIPFEIEKETQGKGFVDKAVPLDDANQAGYLVLTGQIAGKKHDFLLMDHGEKYHTISEEEWQQFLGAHEFERGVNKQTGQSGAWGGYWRERYYTGHEMPVFWVKVGKRTKISLAKLPRLAADYGVHQAIDSVGSDHLASLDDPGSGYDLADLLFGAVGEQPETALKGRVSLESASAGPEVAMVEHPPCILNGPKAGFFPNYLKQQGDAAQGRGGNGFQYQTYMELNGKRPQARGFKRYPVKGAESNKVIPAPANNGNTDVQVQLTTLEPGTRFRGRIIFHNLKPVELGALLWVTTWGGEKKLRHSLGMGKPFGFGQCHFEVDEKKSQLRSNMAPAEWIPLSEKLIREWLDEFMDHMEEAHQEEKHMGWLSSHNIRSLIAMADPAAASLWKKTLGAKLQHPVLDPDNKRDEFREAKEDQLFLPDYVEATAYVPDMKSRAGLPQNLSRLLGELIDQGAPKRQRLEALRGKELAEKISTLDDETDKQQCAEKMQSMLKKMGAWKEGGQPKPGSAQSIYEEILSNAQTAEE